MRLALITPSYLPTLRGNAITVHRIASGLAERGISVRVCALDRDAPDAVRAALAAARPDLVHGFHATVAGALAVEIGQALAVPAVVTLTGTDVNADLFDAARRPALLQTLGRADALVAFHASIAAKLLREAPALAGSVHVIGQAVRMPGRAFDLRSHLGLEPAHCVFLQPAGIRRVKNIPAVIPAMEALQRRYPQLRYVLAGPVLEPEEAARVAAMLRGCAWARFLGPIPHEQLCAGLPAVDVVLNSSLSEGGMPNAVLEAMAQGVAVLASDIDGNRSIVTDGIDGFLFGSEAEFAAKAERLIREPDLRRRLGERARQQIAATCRPEEEIDQYRALYERVLGARAGDAAGQGGSGEPAAPG
jgi:L-malate glycosyltransferase